jgi:hypothetical protein
MFSAVSNFLLAATNQAFFGRQLLKGSKHRTPFYHNTCTRPFEHSTDCQSDDSIFPMDGARQLVTLFRPSSGDNQLQVHEGLLSAVAAPAVGACWFVAFHRRAGRSLVQKYQ